jgi:hypothetical protein
MGRRVKYRHGPFAGEVLPVDDDVYAEYLLATGYADAVEGEDEPAAERADAEPEELAEDFGGGDEPVR